MTDPLLAVAGTRLPTDRAGIAKVAAQLEGVFLRELMKPMEDDALTDGEPLIGSSADRQWKQLFHDRLAQDGAGGIGLARMIADELARKAGLDAGGAAR